MLPAYPLSPVSCEVDRTCLSSPSHRCLVGLRSKEFGGQANTSNLLCSSKRFWTIFALWQDRWSCWKSHQGVLFLWKDVHGLQQCFIIRLDLLPFFYGLVLMLCVFWHLSIWTTLNNSSYVSYSSSSAGSDHTGQPLLNVNQWALAAHDPGTGLPLFLPWNTSVADQCRPGTPQRDAVL